MKSKLFYTLILAVFISACGVKSKPLPPLQPPVISKGGASFSDVFDESEDDDKKKKKDKK